MPHFENLDQYEITNSKSGKKEIVPIAPHSLQKTDYRPRPRPEGQREPKKAGPEFPEVEIEPISVQQMEKEFRAAGRAVRLSRGKRKKSLLKRILKWFRKLFGGKDKKRKSAKGSNSRRHSQRSGKKPDGRPGKGPRGRGRPGKDSQRKDSPSNDPQGNDGQKSGNRQRRRRRKPSGQKPDGQPQGHTGGESGGQGQQGKKRRRRRSGSGRSRNTPKGDSQ